MKAPILNEIAKASDRDRFILPIMSPDDIDRFINFIYKQGIKPHQYASAGDSFRKYIYNKYAHKYRKKTL